MLCRSAISETSAEWDTIDIEDSAPMVETRLLLHSIAGVIRDSEWPEFTCKGFCPLKAAGAMFPSEEERAPTVNSLAYEEAFGLL